MISSTVRTFSRSYSQLQEEEEEKELERLLRDRVDIIPAGLGKPESVISRPGAPVRQHQFTVIFICSIATILANVAVGTMPLLIPIEIMKKDYMISWTGILFLVYGLVVFVCELFQSKIVPFVGTRRTFVGSTLLLGLCDICFGMLDFTNNETAFGGVGCTIRIFEGLFYAGVMNSAFTILCLTVPSKAILVVGLLDGLIGFGYALGPLISGALLYVSCFTVPYVLFGSLLVLTAIWGHFGLKQVTGAIIQPGFGDVKSLYTDFPFIASAVVVLAMGIVVGFLEATLELYLAQIGTVAEGTIFFVAWTIAAVSSPIWGYILRKTGQYRLLLLLGPFVAALVYVFFGPFPGLSALADHLGLSIFCLILLTVATSMALMAAIDIMLRQAEAHGIANDIVTYAFISAIWLATLYLGEGIGAIVSGTVLDKYNYPAVTLALVLIEVMLGLTGGVLLLLPWDRYCGRCRKISEETGPSSRDGYEIIS